MARIQSVPKEKAQEPVKHIYEAIEKKAGKVPNIFLNMGNSAPVLQGFLSLSEAAERTSLSPKLREQIALATSESNSCGYCLAAHTMMAKGTGMTPENTIEARKGVSSDPKTQAVLSFVKKVVEKRGAISDQDFSILKNAKLTDKEIVEIILVINVNMFTNYFNHITDPAIDFPACQRL